MAERKSGPIKPPIIDLTVQKTGGPAPKKPPETTKATRAEAHPVADKGKRSANTSGTARKTSTQPTQAPPKTSKIPPPPSRQSPAVTAILGAMGGAVLGIALAYGLAMSGYWPTPNAPATQPASAELESKLAAQNAQQNTALSDVRASIDDLEKRVTEQHAGADARNLQFKNLQTRIAALEAIGSLPEVNLTPINSALTEMKTRIELLAAVGGANGEALPIEALVTLEQKLAALTEQVSTLTQSNQTDMENLRSELNALIEAAQSQSETTNAQNQTGAQISLALSGFNAALASGRPYQDDLALLSISLPDLAIPQIVAERAVQGMVAPEALLREFSQTVPKMLAVKPVNPNAGWQERALEKLKAAVALRPSGPIEGDTPEAVLSRLEAAIITADFNLASSLYQSLPEPMRTAAPTLGKHIESLTLAHIFVRHMRAMALEVGAMENAEGAAR